MLHQSPLDEALGALLGTGHSLLQETDLLQPLLSYLQEHSIQNIQECRIEQHLTTEALPLDAAAEEGWVGWIQMEQKLQARDAEGDTHILQWEQLIPFRLPPR